MAIVHYLDASRLGLMTPAASDRHQELAQFATEHAATTWTDRLLESGGNAWPDELKQQYPSLSDFPGIEEFRYKLLRQLRAEPWQKVVFASTSDTHLRIASSLLFGPCKRVLVTDLTWPVYFSFLQRFGEQSAREIVFVKVRDLILRGSHSPIELCRYILEKFDDSKCSGLFLTAVSHDGIRFPAAEAVELIRNESSLSFSVIDGAQEFGQVDHAPSVTASDFYMTSGHKWLGGYLPLSIAVFGRNRSASRIAKITTDLIESTHVDDPLLRFAWDNREVATLSSRSTANIAALLSCDAALNDFSAELNGIPPLALCDSDYQELERQLGNSSWHLLDVPEPYRSRVCIVKGQSNGKSNSQIRDSIAEAGIATTVLSGGRARLSIPRQNWTPKDQNDVGRRLKNLVA